MTGWRLLLTRPAEECEALAATLAEAGVHSSSLPLLAIEPLPESAEQRATILELDRYWPQPPFGQAWFSVGGATGAILEAYGLDVSWPERGDDSEALLALPRLAQALARPDPKVLIMRGEGGREFLAETLRGRGVQVDFLELYRRSLPDYPPGTLVQVVRSERLNGLVVSSGQGLLSLHELAADTWRELCELPLFVPSPRVAEMARQLGAKRIVDCRGAGAAALLAALRETAVAAS